VINVDKVPVSDALNSSIPRAEQFDYILNYGDDYELLFTVPESNKSMLDMKLRQYGVEASCVGQIKSGEGEIELLLDGEQFNYQGKGFQHFTKEPV
jgi:thiamine-monophosphate kinase